MSAQGPQYHGTKAKSSEESRWRENTVSQTPLPTRHRAFMKPLPGGRSLEFSTSTKTRSSSHPFKVTVFPGSNKFTVAVGTYNSVIPTLGGTSLSEKPTGTISGDSRFYLRVKYTLQIEEYDIDGVPFNWCNHALLSSVQIHAIDEEKTDEPNADGEYFIILARYQDEVTNQFQSDSICGEVCGLIDGSGDGALHWNNT